MAEFARPRWRRLSASLALLATLVLLPGCGGLMLRSYPTGAEIYVDGRPTGQRTPVKINLDDGAHNIEARIPGYRSQTLVASSRISVGRIVWSVLLPPLAPFYAIGGYRIYEPKSLSFALDTGDGGYGQQQQQQQQQTVVVVPGGGVTTGQAGGASGSSRYDELERLGELRERGLLTDEEYRQEKARVLGGR